MYLGELLERTYRAIHADIVDGVATGGSATTIIDTSLSGRYQANKFRNWVAIITRTPTGLAPQNEYSIITGYANTSKTATFGNMSASVSAGSEYAFCKPDIPLYTLIKLCNDGMKGLGRIQLVDSSLTVAANTVRYTLPLALKGRKPTRIYFRNPTTLVTADAPNYDVEPAASGTQATLVFKIQFATSTTGVFQTYNGWEIVIHYEGIHEPLTVFNSPVNETIHDNLAVAACVEKAMMWKVYPRQRKTDKENWALAKNALEEARKSFPIEQPVREQQYVPIGIFNGRR